VITPGGSRGVRGNEAYTRVFDRPPSKPDYRMSRPVITTSNPQNNMSHVLVTRNAYNN